MAFRSARRLVTRRLGIQALRADMAAHAAALAAHQASLVQHAVDINVLVEQSRAARLAQTIVWATMWNAADPSPLATLVTVVLPTRNRADLVLRAVRSVLQQANVRIELIVVNDASTDHTAAVLATIEDPRVTVLVGGAAGVGAGCGAARNIAIKHATGDIIAFVDDDNIMAPGWLAAAARHLSQHEESAGVYGAQIREPEQAGDLNLLYRAPFNRDELLVGNFIDIGAAAFRAGTDELHFDDSLDGLEDWDMFIRITSTQRLDPIPVLSCFYSTSAQNRLSHQPEMTEALLTVQRRVAAERALRACD